MAYARNQLKLVVVGHVDHGKSTLIGRLFYDTGSLPDGKYEQLVAIAQRRGVPFEFANLMDALQAERDQNITIDTTQIWFRTPKREYVIIDAPGHKEFVKNMVTGAARADAALIIIDASEGVQEQTRRHGSVAADRRPPGRHCRQQDGLVDYSQTVFDKVSSSIAFFSSIGVVAQIFIPVSAREGDNIATRREPKWFTGGRPPGAQFIGAAEIETALRSYSDVIASTIAAFSRGASKQARFAPAISSCSFPRGAPAWCDRSSAGTHRRSNR